jgi:hypothetical protein
MDAFGFDFHSVNHNHENARPALLYKNHNAQAKANKKIMFFGVKIFAVVTSLPQSAREDIVWPKFLLLLFDLF